MSEPGRMSESESEVMEVVWEKGEVSAHEVQEELSKKKSWAYNTVATFLQRLCEKRFAASRREGKTNYYRALISREEYQKSVTRDFLNSIHHGSKRSLIASLFDGEVNDEEIERLLRLIEEK